MPGFAVLDIDLETGRTHQLRIHALAGLGSPLLGDPVYGNGKGAKRTMLHAESLIVAREGKPAIEAKAPGAHYLRYFCVSHQEGMILLAQRNGNSFEHYRVEYAEGVVKPERAENK